jgi:hypothetical protein
MSVPIFKQSLFKKYTYGCGVLPTHLEWLLSVVFDSTESVDIGNQADKPLDLAVFFQGMSQGFVGVDPVGVIAADFVDDQITILRKVSDDLEHCSFGDADLGGDFTDSGFRIAG